ncbi:hypothetical protein PM082_017185 [Marasmius tenuissimus]|nr:hypothetical protein PM082_017185 [Marasmius tenuissimus]
MSEAFSILIAACCEVCAGACFDWSSVRHTFTENLCSCACCSCCDDDEGNIRLEADSESEETVIVNDQPKPKGQPNLGPSAGDSSGIPTT